MKRAIQLTTVMVLAMLGATLAADEPRPTEQRPTVVRSPDGLRVYLDIPAPEGRASMRDVARALAEVAQLDDEAIGLSRRSGSIHVVGRTGRLTLAAMNVALSPGLHFRVLQPEKEGDDLVLRITIDRAALLEKKRAAKDKVRSKLLTQLERSAEGKKPRYGIRLDDGWQKKDKPLVVLIHGFNSTPERTLPLLVPIRDAGYPCGTFAYPNDHSLAHSAALLSRDLKQIARDHPDRAVTLLTYSMGGLIARKTIEDPELAPSGVQQIVMVAPPNHGTSLARAAFGFDLWEHLAREKDRTAMQRLHGSLQDGLAEAVTDLRPGSVFLTRLNQRKRNERVRYTIFLGSDGPLTDDKLDRLRQKLAAASQKSKLGRLLGKKIDALMADLDEVVHDKGDGVVSLKRGQLGGVDDVVVLPFSHGDPVRRTSPEAIERLHLAILKRLLHEK